MALLSKVFATQILPVILSLAIIRPDQSCVNFPTIKHQDLENFSTNWNSPGLLQVFVSKRTHHSDAIKFLLRSASTKTSIDAYLDLSNEINASDDPMSDQLMHMNLCTECQLRSSQCKTCSLWKS